MVDELNAAKTFAVRAGAILLKYRTQPAVSWKYRGDPVTDADRAASTFLANGLQRLFPADAILSEEEPDTLQRLTNRRVWIIDPLDGTLEYIKGLGEFAVMIGLAIDGVAALGVVYQPLTQKLYYAEMGCGAFLIENRHTSLLRVSTESKPEAMTMALSRSHPSAAVEAIRSDLHIGNTLICGSIGLKVGLICEGRAYIYLNASSHTSQWDTCAPDVILREAGGQMTDLRNASFRYNVRETHNTQGVLATNGAIHEQVVQAARQQ